MRGLRSDCIRNLKEDPMSFAMMMDDGELEEVIVAFVGVLNKKNQSGGGQN
jgi:hypothetical protein